MSKPICSHFQCSVLLSKKITEPICSDFVKIMKNVLYCFYCLVKCETVGCSQSVQRFAAGSLAMRSYSAMERQSAAATGVKKETPDSHGFVPGDAW